MLKRAIAETVLLLGDFRKGEELFQGYLFENPKWDWGWIGWSDQYWLFKRKNYVLKKVSSTPALKINI